MDKSITDIINIMSIFDFNLLYFENNYCSYKNDSGFVIFFKYDKCIDFCLDLNIFKKVLKIFKSNNIEDLKIEEDKSNPRIAKVIFSIKNKKVSLAQNSTLSLMKKNIISDEQVNKLLSTKLILSDELYKEYNESVGFFSEKSVKIFVSEDEISGFEITNPNDKNENILIGKSSDISYYFDNKIFNINKNYKCDYYYTFKEKKSNNTTIMLIICLIYINENPIIVYTINDENPFLNN